MCVLYDLLPSAPVQIELSVRVCARVYMYMYVCICIQALGTGDSFVSEAVCLDAFVDERRESGREGGGTSAV